VEQVAPSIAVGLRGTMYNFRNMSDVDSSLPGGGQTPANASGLTDVVELSRTVWGQRWLFCGMLLSCTAIATLYAFLAPQWYLSEGLLIPASPKSTQGLAGALGGLGGLGGLAGAAGLNLLGETKTSEPIAVLRSRDLIREFIQQNDLMPILYAKKWDAAARRWKDARPSKQPDLRDAVKYFQENILTVQEDKKTGLVTISVEWKDANLAAAWANQLIERVNVQMRDRALAEAESNVEYLRKQLGTTSETSLQQAASRLLESELQKSMLARGNREFAFRVIDRPEPPKHRSEPKRGISVGLGFLAGGIFGVLVVVVRQAFKNASAATPRGRR
jgi:uncharacterized protein involved in exopolysaccharide biosynthesis